MEQFFQQKILDMEQGLFLIKYESSESPDYPPSVRIAAEQGSETTVELILAADAAEAVLWSPGASLVARARIKSRLRVMVAAAEPNGSVAARVQVIPLSDDPGGSRERKLSSPRLDLSEFRVLGHVAGRGDVIVDADNWVGGPMAPSRIEGIAIQWPGKPRDLSLRYAVTVGGPRPIAGQVVEAGDFAGTRGRALPLVGATLEIDGPAASGHQLMVELIFLGSPQTKIMGRQVALAGPTRREPLVGIRIRIEPQSRPKLALQPRRAPNAGQNEKNISGEYIQQEETMREGRTPRRLAPTAVTQRERNPVLLANTLVSPTTKRAGRVRVFRSRPRTEHG